MRPGKDESRFGVCRNGSKRRRAAGTRPGDAASHRGCARRGGQAPGAGAVTHRHRGASVRRRRHSHSPNAAISGGIRASVAASDNASSSEIDPVLERAAVGQDDALGRGLVGDRRELRIELLEARHLQPAPRGTARPVRLGTARGKSWAGAWPPAAGSGAPPGHRPAPPGRTRRRPRRSRRRRCRAGLRERRACGCVADRTLPAARGRITISSCRQAREVVPPDLVRTGRVGGQAAGGCGRRRRRPQPG